MTEQNNIIGVPNKVGAKLPLQTVSLPYPVQYMEIEISQERRDNPALWCTLAISFATPDIPLLTVPTPLNDGSLEPQANQVQECSVTHALGYNRHQLAVGDGVKVLGKIGIDDFCVPLIEMKGHIINRVMG